MRPDINKIIESMDRELWKKITEPSVTPLGVLNSPPISQIQPFRFDDARSEEFVFRCRFDYGVTCFRSVATLDYSNVDDRPRPPGMPFVLFAALEILWLRIDLDLFDRRLVHVIS
jgi:hypothetical protein